MTEHAQDRLWSGIDIPKTLAGALAAVCAAVIGSFLGVAGTLVGAAVASVIGSIGTEVYHRSLRKGAQRLQATLAPTFVKAPAAVGTPEVPSATEEDSPSHTVPEDERKGRLRWSRIGLAAAALFVLCMGTLTAVELLAGKSVASMVGGGSSGSTTLSSVTDGGAKSDDTPAPAVSETPDTPATDDGSEPGSTPDSGPTGTDPGTPTDSPTTEAPTTGTPTTDPAAPDSGSGQQPGGSGGTAGDGSAAEAPAEGSSDAGQ